MWDFTTPQHQPEPGEGSRAVEDILPCSRTKIIHLLLMTIALTSHIMEVLERLLLVYPNKQTSTFQDPLQFAYHHGVGVEETIHTPASTNPL